MSDPGGHRRAKVIILRPRRTAQRPPASEPARPRRRRARLDIVLPDRVDALRRVVRILFRLPAVRLGSMIRSDPWRAYRIWLECKDVKPVVAALKSAGIDVIDARAGSE